MSKYYLLFIQSRLFIERSITSTTPRFTLHQADPYWQENDIVLVVRLGESKIVLPFEYKVVAINRNAHTLTLQRVATLNQTVDLRRVIEERIAAVNYQEYDAVELTHNQFDHLRAQMGGPRLDEKALLNSVQNYIAARGYYFDEETLYNYHICLKTRPFVILAGLSGTGKSKLSQLYAEALGSRTRYLRLPVRPNWSDDRYLLGYFDTITGEYITEPAVEFLLEANADEDHLYFFCLDEMNLAHVEYYFSQFLSAMEEERPEDRRITLMSKRVQQQMLATPERAQIAEKLAQVLIPTNLFFTGTINVDETTQPISDKVMDRANTLEFFRVDLDKIRQPTTPPQPVNLSAYTWRSYQNPQPDTRFRPQIVEISRILNEADLGLGYRVLHEIELYVANSKNLLDPLAAFDLQVKQRILPRVRGSEVISEMVDTLLAYLKAQGLTRSEQRLAEMKKRLKRDGYTNFWR